LPETTVPEIQRSNLAPVLLQLKRIGVDNLVRFDFLNPPPSTLMAKSLELLYSLGALDDNAKLTQPLGTRMAELPLEPMMAKILLSAPDFGCVEEMLTIAAMTSLGGAVWFYRDGEEKKMKAARARFAAREGDHLTLYNAYQAFTTVGKHQSKFCHENHLNYQLMQKAVKIRDQLKRNLQSLGVDVTNNTHTLHAKPGGGPALPSSSSKGEIVRRCLTTGYFAHAARMKPDGTFTNVQGDRTFWPHPSSLMFNLAADWVVYHEAVEMGDKIFLRDVTAIEKEWLVQYAPHFYSIQRPTM
jgi:ATP-dependent RNA helicase DDX35